MRTDELIEWVKTSKAQNEQMFSGLPGKADLRPARK